MYIVSIEPFKVPFRTFYVATFTLKHTTVQCLMISATMLCCSAGVGRTDPYIVLDSMLKHIKDQSTDNIHGFCKHIRTQRNNLVQTEVCITFVFQIVCYSENLIIHFLVCKVSQ